jgi:hypothetical protein
MFTGMLHGIPVFVYKKEAPKAPLNGLRMIKQLAKPLLEECFSCPRFWCWDHLLARGAPATWATEQMVLHGTGK